MTDQELFNAQARIVALERKVTDLYEKLGQAEPQLGDAAEGTGGGSALAAADVDPEVMKHVEAGNEVKAIKRYRELTGVGLAEATDAIRALNRAHGPISDPRF